MRFTSLLPVLALAMAAPSATGQSWTPALPGWTYAFPRDHRNHPDFKTEWWYFTGNLADSAGNPFGFQLTFFRQGISPSPPQTTSRFVTANIQFAHFALSDPTTRRFRFFHEISRGAYGEAGFDDDGPRLAWIHGWECTLVGEHSFHLKAASGDTAIDLLLEAEKEPVFHGADGVSQKSEGPGRASHYYSLTRMRASGMLTLGGRRHEVAGLAWFDHEWATNQLDDHQTGWDWFSLHLDDGSDLMIFQIRTTSGTRDPHSAGTHVAANGSVTPIGNDAFRLEPSGRPWKSPATGGKYPVAWNLAIPSLDLELAITAAFNAQELTPDPIAYWEGAIRAKGSVLGQPVTGSGYLEMTGYGSPIVGMQAAP
jgi:predicted secreted hydrolase